MIKIKENQYGNLDIKIDNREYLNVPSSKPKDIVVASSGKGYPEGQYYIRLGFDWTEEEIKQEEIYDKYKEVDFRFDDTETLFSFLNVYLNWFEWGYGE